MIAISGVLIQLTVNQGKIWKDSMTLWKYELSLYPSSAYQAYYNLGNAYDSLGLIDKAIEQYKISLKINPYYLATYNTLGALYQTQGLIDDYPDVYYNLGLAYQTQGLIDEAIEQYEFALKLKPDRTIQDRNKT
jgi:superkiller protein 3